MRDRKMSHLQAHNGHAKVEGENQLVFFKQRLADVPVQIVSEVLFYCI